KRHGEETKGQGCKAERVPCCTIGAPALCSRLFNRPLDRSSIPVKHLDPFAETSMFRFVDPCHFVRHNVLTGSAREAGLDLEGKPRKSISEGPRQQIGGIPVANRGEDVGHFRMELPVTRHLRKLLSK